MYIPLSHDQSRSHLTVATAFNYKSASLSLDTCFDTLHSALTLSFGSRSPHFDGCHVKSDVRKGVQSVAFPLHYLVHPFTLTTAPMQICFFWLEYASKTHLEVHVGWQDLVTWVLAKITFSISYELVARELEIVLSKLQISICKNRASVAWWKEDCPIHSVKAAMFLALLNI